jgi:hypothetical protein
VVRGQRQVSQLPHNEEKNDEDAPIDANRNTVNLSEPNVLVHLPSTSTIPSPTKQGRVITHHQHGAIGTTSDRAEGLILERPGFARVPMSGTARGAARKWTWSLPCRGCLVIDSIRTGIRRHFLETSERKSTRAVSTRRVRARGVSTDSDKKATPQLVRDKSFEETARHNLHLKVEGCLGSPLLSRISLFNVELLMQPIATSRTCTQAARGVSLTTRFSHHTDPAKKFGMSRMGTRR